MRLGWIFSMSQLIVASALVEEAVNAINNEVVGDVVQSMQGSANQSLQTRMARFSAVDRLQTASYQLGGQSFNELDSGIYGLLASYSGQVATGGLNWKNLLNGTAMVLPLAGFMEGFSIHLSNAALWIEGSYKNLEDLDGGDTVRWEGGGGVSGGMDVRYKENILLGTALSWSIDRFVDYSDFRTGESAASSEGEYDLYSVRPYVAWAGDSLNVWSSVASRNEELWNSNGLSDINQNLNTSGNNDNMNLAGELSYGLLTGSRYHYSELLELDLSASRLAGREQDRRILLELGVNLCAPLEALPKGCPRYHLLLIKNECVIMNKKLIVFTVGTIAFITTQPVLSQSLPSALKKILANTPKHKHSLYIRETNSSNPLVAIEIDKPRVPASVIKLITTYAGLSLLGPHYIWQTRVYLDGNLKNGILDGNLILAGGGDPFLTNERFWLLLQHLQARGIKHIRGNLMLDKSMFEIETGTTGDFDNRPYRIYNAFPYPMLLDMGAHTFYFVPADKQLNISVFPPTTDINIENNIRLVSGSCNRKNYKLKLQATEINTVPTITFSGRYAKRCGVKKLARNVVPNKAYLYGVFNALWQEMGGTLNGTIKDGKASGKPFYIFSSKPLSEVINGINKYSNNVMARQLMLTIGYKKGGEGTKAKSRHVISDWLNQLKIPTQGLFIDNGSGLSRESRVSARTLASLLSHAFYSRYQPEFLTSLPLLGIDGTIKKRLRKKLPPASARIKTGTINDVKTMAGYLTSQSGKKYIVVSLQNYRGAQGIKGTQAQDKILQWLYRQ